MSKQILKLFLFSSIFSSCFFFANVTQAATTIEAQVVRNQAGSGSTLISSGFPLPPGLVTEAMINNGTIRVIVSGAEVATNISALRGRHQDGTLRSMLIQFNYAMAQNEEINAQIIIDGGTRQFSDPTYQRPTFDIVNHNNIILPTDPNYLASTQITFQSLLPIGTATVAEEKQYTTLADNRFDALAISGLTGTARYEEVRAMLSLWVRSGNIKYFNHAVSYAIDWLDYSTPGSAASPDCKADEYVNPDGRAVTSNTTCGLAAEWQFARVLSYADMYLLTGYRDFWSIVAYNAQVQQAAITNQTIATTQIIKLGGYDLPRYNYASRYGALIAAMMIDATIPISGQYITARQLDWSDQLEWTLNAIDSTKWDLQWLPFDNGSGTVPATGAAVTQGGVTATVLGVYSLTGDPQTFSGSAMPATGYIQVNNIMGGSFSAGALSGISVTATGANISDYRQGMTGTRSNSPRLPNYSSDTVIPSFQMVFVTNFLIDYYLLIRADNRIPAMVKTNLDILLSQIRPMAPGDTYYGVNGGTWGNPIYGKPYSLKNPISNEDANPYELPEYARMVAFVLKTSGEATVNGATYSTWYERLIDTANNSPVGVLIWQWKLFGQFYGFGSDAPWMMAQNSLLNYGPSEIRIPTQWDSIPDNEITLNLRSDVDNSSATNTTDALLTLRNSLGLSMDGTAWQASATTGDVNCDEVSNSTDALLILRYSLGLSMGETSWCE
ncbi:MAG: hypothetical protein UR66_C0015G0010 [Candidatus Moranbacteria bacterium GW2011_GWE1_35_17]|nr:MAG: hypothetical protein UR66_C0015G0010 [Candidatus Moranbacteria bacterium GW2011_GWE1_35_17]KKP71944.1 MAG: hypothetical protein UR65_C0023G0011 [Candidatus Moranbacteria bacterium GW2011_GWE2_35_164]KKP82703.1 MAG: hypothetical protein UR83_C0048G0005 [Candidatus Moranbacteria bacterium GW2011_GWF2_35_54]KKP83005.1 MAG: hypothetical protein UR82_C0026G0005 [Candidatus Moranbacteria bacterium GW2011_GWF1_35_5]